MIGIVVTGHGSFAAGLTSGLELLAGQPEYYEAVDFAPEDSIEMLEEKLLAALARLDGCDGIIIFTDLTGGSPFNVSSKLKRSGYRCPLEVTGGTNLPVVLNAYMTRTMITDLAELADTSLAAGKEQMIRLVLTDHKADADDEEYEE